MELAPWADSDTRAAKEPLFDFATVADRRLGDDLGQRLVAAADHNAGLVSTAAYSLKTRIDYMPVVIGVNSYGRLTTEIFPRKSHNLARR